MLGYIIASAPGTAIATLTQVVAKLRQAGRTPFGVLQVNSDTHPGAKCDMDLQVLGTDQTICISQNLGALSKGCRLDPDGLERAVGLVQTMLEQTTPDILIINKFGKQEAAGRGFRPLIGQALAAEIPVLTAVNTLNIDAFHAFAEDVAEPLPLDPDAVIARILHELPPS